MHVSIPAQKQAEAARWAAMKLDPARIASFDKVAKRLTAPAAKARYQAIEAATGVPWWAIAVIHEREAGQDFACQLAQGDRLDQVSHNEPAGRGPFLDHPDDPPLHDAFYRGALDALIDCPPHAAKWGDWTVGGTLTLFIIYNGEGYAARGLPSPYVWSGTDRYVRGKYVADGVFDPDAVDHQDGCAPLLARMMALDPSIRFADAPGIPKPAAAPPSVPSVPAPAPHREPTVADIIHDVDGWLETLWADRLAGRK